MPSFRQAAGDELLRRCGEVLQTSLRQQDIAARLGGDEFAVLCIECDPASGGRLVERLRAAFVERALEVSLGVACRDPAHGLVHTLHQADQAMYGEKRTRGQAMPR